MNWQFWKSLIRSQINMYTWNLYGTMHANVIMTLTNAMAFGSLYKKSVSRLRSTEDTYRFLTGRTLPCTNAIQWTRECFRAPMQYSGHVNAPVHQCNTMDTWMLPCTSAKQWTRECSRAPIQYSGHVNASVHQCNTVDTWMLPCTNAIQWTRECFRAPMQYSGHVNAPVHQCNTVDTWMLPCTNTIQWTRECFRVSVQYSGHVKNLPCHVWWALQYLALWATNRN